MISRACGASRMAPASESGHSLRTTTLCSSAIGTGPYVRESVESAELSPWAWCRDEKTTLSSGGGRDLVCDLMPRGRGCVQIVDQQPAVRVVWPAQVRNLAVAWRPRARRALSEAGRLAEVDAEIAAWATTQVAPSSSRAPPVGLSIDDAARR